jgi:hypothetical protein
MFVARGMESIMSKNLRGFETSEVSISADNDNKPALGRESATPVVV